MTDVQDDRLMRDGFREKALAELGIEAEVRWIGPETKADVSIDVLELDRLTEMAGERGRAEAGREDSYNEGVADGVGTARRRVLRILKAAPSSAKATLDAVRIWAEEA